MIFSLISRSYKEAYAVCMHMCVFMCVATCMHMCLRVRGLQANVYRNMLPVQIIFESMCDNIMTFHNAILLRIVEKSFEMLQEDLLILVQMKFFIYFL